MTDTPLTAEELTTLKQEGLPICLDWPFCKNDCSVCNERDSSWERILTTIAALTTRAEKAEARVAELEAALGGADPFPVALAAMQWATALDAPERIVLERRLREELLKWRAALEGTLP